jgi:sugar O-acyltransferase (sialic acid O-acetyltransferase NeuD family)
VTAVGILLVGAGGHAAACIDVIEQERRFVIAGLVGSPAEVAGKVLGYPVLGSDEDLPGLAARWPCALVAVGQIKSAAIRVELFARLRALGCELPSIISPRAYVSPHAELGAGTIVMHGAVVNARAVIGSNCIINSQALVEHDAVIGDHCHIATGAAVNGGVRIGAQCFIGSRSSVRQGLTLGERCVIGMGQQVLADCSAGAQLPGNKSS